MTALIGHGRVIDALRAAVDRDQLHHAYLFEGPKGVGKRAVADHLAAYANCTGTGARPCGACRPCAAIRAGTHPDVIVLEPDTSRAARAIPVEHIRETLRKAQFHRYDARHRFVVIDPAEAMLEPAANALLKTLEEPPADTHFVLVSHSPRSLLPTIRSRCQRLRFGAVSTPEITQWLAGRGVTGPVAAAATRTSLGCPGRALDLAGGGLEARRALRERIAAALVGPLDGIYALSGELTQGARQDWGPRVDGVLELVEDFARDAAVRASGSRVDELDEGAGDDVAGEVVARLAAGWPSAVSACAQAVQDVRDDLEVYVSGKLALDALFTAVRREL